MHTSHEIRACADKVSHARTHDNVVVVDDDIGANLFITLSASDHTPASQRVCINTHLVGTRTFAGESTFARFHLAGHAMHDDESGAGAARVPQTLIRATATSPLVGRACKPRRVRAEERA